ncbi:MAG: hypothetical protein U1E51_06860 [Candidatus Binatia bacterium]|nr:hypothetical protein [Candidatus Binatia bacterium]
MKWSPARDEDGKWRLERHRPNLNFAQPNNGAYDFSIFDHIASVERSDADMLTPAQYRAEVLDDPDSRYGRILGLGWKQKFRSCQTLFSSLREAQMWCEREVRMMEVAELE